MPFEQDIPLIRRTAGIIPYSLGFLGDMFIGATAQGQHDANPNRPDTWIDPSPLTRRARQFFGDPNWPSWEQERATMIRDRAQPAPQVAPSQQTTQTAPREVTAESILEVLHPEYRAEASRMSPEQLREFTTRYPRVLASQPAAQVATQPASQAQPAPAASPATSAMNQALDRIMPLFERQEAGRNRLQENALAPLGGNVPAPWDLVPRFQMEGGGALTPEVAQMQLQAYNPGYTAYGNLLNTLLGGENAATQRLGTEGGMNLQATGMVGLPGLPGSLPTSAANAAAQMMSALAAMTQAENAGVNAAAQGAATAGTPMEQIINLLRARRSGGPVQLPPQQRVDSLVRQRFPQTHTIPSQPAQQREHIDALFRSILASETDPAAQNVLLNNMAGRLNYNEVTNWLSGGPASDPARAALARALGIQQTTPSMLPNMLGGRPYYRVPR